ncbi:MAG: exodeoxyribonuclease III [Chitinophagales bacterium]|nr:exodeoxyribonuclease III [Chitinophagales bacterium]MDW8273927.1 exodeoxyribonuclease III [Chitinophagales bacterium]
MNISNLSVVSYNVNGIRAAENKGLSRWVERVNPDIICLQEIKASAEEFPTQIFEKLGYHVYLFPSIKKGYSGVGIISKYKADNVVCGIGIESHDLEGRNIRIDLSTLSVMSAYFPSGTTGDERQAIKMKYLDDFFDYIQSLRQQRPRLIIAGDYNICHREIDIHDPVRNKDVSGFKPEERAWMEKFFSNGFTDTFRYLNPEARDQYSWWSFRANARAKNKGWRIDYIAVTDNLKHRISEAKMFQDVVHSDHCPVFCRLNGIE